MSQIRDQVREYDTITVTPSTPHIGAEIGNIDLTRPLSNRQVEEVHDAIIAHGVIFFRNQKIDFESHERLVRYFGEPHIHVGGKGTASKTIPGYPAIRKQFSTPIQNAFPARNGIPTRAAPKSRQCTACSTRRSFRRTAAATPCSLPPIGPTKN